MTKLREPLRWYNDNNEKVRQILTRARELEINLEEISKINLCRFYREELLTNPSMLPMRTKRTLVIEGVLKAVKTNYAKKVQLTDKGRRLLEELSHEEAP